MAIPILCLHASFAHALQEASQVPKVYCVELLCQVTGSPYTTDISNLSLTRSESFYEADTEHPENEQVRSTRLAGLKCRLFDHRTPTDVITWLDLQTCRIKFSNNMVEFSKFHFEV